MVSALFRPIMVALALRPKVTAIMLYNTKRDRHSLEPIMPGYSGTPLAKKLGIKAGGTLYAVGAPNHYGELLAPLPEGVTFGSALDRDTDVIHLFTDSRKHLGAELRPFPQRDEARCRHLGVLAKKGLEGFQPTYRGRDPREWRRCRLGLWISRFVPWTIHGRD